MSARKLLAASISLALASMLPSGATAATEAQKQAAIDSGLAWLASQQAGNGSWSGTGYNAADTSAALLAFIEQKSKPMGWNGQDYSALVTSGLNYLMTQATPVNVGTRPDGFNADIGGSGTGLYWGAISETTYISGIALGTLARAVSSGYVSAGTMISGTGNAAVDGKTYGTVIQETVNLYLAGQTTASGGVYRGGWHYFPSQGDADNSTAQWAAIGMLMAQSAGATIPQYTRDELKYWIDYIQCSNGGSGYNSPCGGAAPVSESKTGGLLVEMAFAGYSGYGPTDTLGRNEALAYINSNWQVGLNAWNGNFGHPYAMWSIYKGLESTIGLTDTTTITNLRPQGGAMLDPGDTWNWYEDYAESLVTGQLGTGNWNGYYYWPTLLSTAWNINILNATQIGPGPDNGVPEPVSVTLVGLALLALSKLRQRRIV